VPALGPGFGISPRQRGQVTLADPTSSATRKAVSQCGQVTR
jgi:hypothetical protein